MPTYDILKDYATPNGPIEMNARALMVVWRFKTPTVFDHAKPDNVSADKPNDKLLARGQTDPHQVAGPFLISNDIASLNVTSQIGSHNPSLSAELRPGKRYLSLVLPGDYLAAWICKSEEDFNTLLQNIRKLPLTSGAELGTPEMDNASYKSVACNGFLSGLKFFGKVRDVRKNIRVSSEGHKSVTFSMNAIAFSELDSGVYYEPAYALGDVAATATNWQRYLGINLNEVLVNITNQTTENGKTGNGGVGTNLILPALLSVFLGDGVPKDLMTINNKRGEKRATQVTTGADSIDAFLLPTQVAAMFGATRDGPKFKYKHILQFWHGLPNFSSNPNNKPQTFTFKEGLAKDRITKRLPLETFSGKFQQGLFVPQAPHMSGHQSIWNILSQYGVVGLNQMTVGLRPNAEGLLYPTIWCRQLPLNSGVLNVKHLPNGPEIEDFKQAALREEEEWIKARKGKAKKDIPPQYRSDYLFQNKKEAAEYYRNGVKATHHDLKVVRLSEIPRWIVGAPLIRGLSVGRSDALRRNYVHLQISTGDGRFDNPTSQITRVPPIRNEIDIQRHGFRPYITTVPAGPMEVTEESSRGWQAVMADILCDQDLTLTGQIECVGIIHPINPGDALEVDETMFHIEGVSHSFSQSANGQTSFRTSMSLTQGTAGNITDDPLTLFKAIDGRDDISESDPDIEAWSALKDGNVEP